MTKKSNRALQVQRGLEAVSALAKFLESKNGNLTVSIHESKYSSGAFGKPDLVFKGYGIEVKRLQMFCKHNFYEKQYAHLGHFSLLHQSWEDFKCWCVLNLKTPLLVVALYYGQQKPIFVRLSKSQVDKLQSQQRHKKWISLNGWECLRQGEILT